MSVTAPKPTQTPSEVGTLQIEAKHRDIEAEIDAKVKDPDKNKKYKATLQGIRERIESAWCIASSHLPFDRLSPVELQRRAAHSAQEIEHKMRPLIDEAERAASREDDRRATGAELAAKVSSLQRPGRKRDPVPSSPPAEKTPIRSFTNRPPHHGPHPHVKVLPSTQLDLDVPTIDSLTDRLAGLRFESSMAVARVAAAPIHAAGYVISATIKEARKQSPLVDAVAIGAGKAVRAAKSWVKEEIPGAAGFVRELGSGLTAMPADIEEQYGIPQQKTRQWIDDTLAIATTGALAGAGKGLALAGKSMLATSDAVAAVVKAKPPLSYADSLKLRVAERAPTKAPPPPHRLLPAPPKVVPEATMPAVTAAPVATTRDWVVSNIAASKAGHASAAYQAFDRAVSSAALQRTAPPLVPTNSSEPFIREQRPLYDYTSYEPIKPSRIPTRETGQPATFHKRVETVPANGNLYDVELACIRHECGTWSLFANKITPHNPEVLTSGSSGRVLSKLRSTLIHIARDQLEAPAVVLQWNPEALAGMAEIAEGAAKRTVHYAGERPAMETLSPLGSLQRLGKAALGARLDIPGNAMPIDKHTLPRDTAFKNDVIGYAGHFFVGASEGTPRISATDSLLAAVRSLTIKERTVPTLTFDLQNKRRKGAVDPETLPTNAPPKGEMPTNPLVTRASVIESAIPRIALQGAAGETVVVFKSTSDHNGALAKPFTEKAKVLAKGRNLLEQEVSIEGEMISTLKQVNKVSHVLFRGHGSEGGFAINPFYGINASEIADILTYAHLTTEGRPEVILEACSMGKRRLVGGLSPAEELYRLLNGRVSVTASNAPMSSMLTQTTPGSIRFFAPNHGLLPTETTFRVGRISQHDTYNQLAQGNSIPIGYGINIGFTSPPEVFSGVLPHDLIVVQSVSGLVANRWLLSTEQAQGMVREGSDILDSSGHFVTSSSNRSNIAHINVIKIPAGEIVNILTGQTAEFPKQFKFRPRAQEHFFYDMDPKWASVMVPWPLPPNTNLSDFESLSAVYRTGCSRAEIIEPTSEGLRDLKPAASTGTISPSREIPTNSAPMVEKTRPISSGMKPAGESVVVIESAHDNTGAFRLPITARVAQLARGRNLIYRRHVGSIEEIRDAMQQTGNVSHVLLRAHGNPRAVHFDSNGTKPEALAYALKKESLVEGGRAQVFLEACSTAAIPSDGSESFAVRLSARLGDRASLVAARAPVIPNYTQMKPGSVQFYGEEDRHLLNSALPNNLRRQELTFRIGRINNSEAYTKLIRKQSIPSASKYLHFSDTPKVFSGVTPRDLVFVQYHNGLPSNTWFISADDAMVLTTMDAIRRQTVLSESIAPFSHMTVTRIPAGENINTLRGNVTAEGKWDSKVHTSAMMQYYFYDFDPKWESVTFGWPCSAEGLDNFDALVSKALESKVTRPTLSLGSKTVYEETRSPFIRQPLPNPAEAPEASLLAKPSIPPLSDVLPQTFQQILTSIEYDRVSADLRISRIAHADGTSRVYIEHLIVQDSDLGERTLTSGLIFQTLTTIRKIVEKEWGGSHVFIQWDPMNPKFLTPSFQAHLERYRHYIGLHDAFPVSPKLMEMHQADKELKARKYPTLVYDLKALL